MPFITPRFYGFTRPTSLAGRPFVPHVFGRPTHHPNLTVQRGHAFVPAASLTSAADIVDVDVFMHPTFGDLAMPPPALDVRGFGELARVVAHSRGRGDLAPTTSIDQITSRGHGPHELWVCTTPHGLRFSDGSNAYEGNWARITVQRDEFGEWRVSGDHLSEDLYIAVRRELNASRVLKREDVQAKLERGDIDFRGLNLRGADLRGSLPVDSFDFRRLFKPELFYDLDLSSANLAGAFLERAKLDGPQIKNILKNGSRLVDGYHDLRGIDLSDVDLKNQDLFFVDLSQANLTNTNFRKANLKNVKLKDAVLNKTGLDRRILLTIIEEGSRLWSSDEHDLRGVNLDWQDLSELDLIRVDLRHASLKGANLENTRIRPQVIVENMMEIHNTDLVKGRGRDIENALFHYEVDVRDFSSFLTLRDAVIIYQGSPISDLNRINQFRKITRRADLLVSHPKYPEGLRRCTHDNPSPNTLKIVRDHLNLYRQYLATNANDANTNEALALLLEAEKILEEIFRGSLNLEQLKSKMNPEIQRYLGIDSLSVISSPKIIGYLAVKIRQAFESGIATKRIRDYTRYQLIRLGISLHSAAFDLTSFQQDQRESIAQAEKIATLFRIAYGSGYGDASLLVVADKLDHLAQQWDGMEEDDRSALLRQYARLGGSVLFEVQQSYHDMFDEVVAENGERWRLSEDERRDFASNQYRASGIFQLGVHLESLGVTPVSPDDAKNILPILKSPKTSPVRYQAIFYGQGEEFDRATMGGKGKGLDDMTRLGLPVPVGLTLPPVILGVDGLNDGQRDVITNALLNLERRVGKTFDQGLVVSVRSGAAVSMPGQMETVTDVKSIDAALVAIERVYRSWNSAGAKAYRMAHGIPDDLGTAVNVIRWVEGDRQDNQSGAGVISSFSATGQSTQSKIAYNHQSRGSDSVDGRGDSLSKLPEHISGVETELRQAVAALEDYYRGPVEVEFTIESGHLWLLQVRRAHLEYNDEIRWYVARVHSEKMTQNQAIQALGGKKKLIEAKTAAQLDLSGNETLIAEGGFGTGQPVSGRVAINQESILAVQALGESAIFLTDDADSRENTPNALEAGAVISGGGNPLTHLAGVAISSHLSHLGGMNVIMDEAAGAVRLGNFPIQSGETVVTLDPRNGRIYAGSVPIQIGESPVALLIDWLLGPL
ncbi:MAG TPA: hypothetical protein DDW49_06495 [Deltaproteobacteria bacterium]|nr:hypothetical protein [Deltaproteobacteria bacterium]